MDLHGCIFFINLYLKYGLIARKIGFQEFLTKIKILVHLKKARKYQDSSKYQNKLLIK